MPPRDVTRGRDLSTPTDRPRRRLSACLLVVGLLAVTVPAAAAAPESRGIDRVCDLEAGPSDEDAAFPDLGTTHARSIACAYEYGIVSGFGDGTFRPGVAITRGQMATFVAAWVRTATGIPLPRPSELPFDDLRGDVHAGSIAALAEAGIVGGRPDGSFAPGDTLTRGQFTRAVANAISYADVFAVGGPLPPLGNGAGFTDVAGTTFEESIDSLASIGVALGTTESTFRPQASVTRGQLATFLMRGADYLDRYQRWRPTARSAVVFVADLTPHAPEVDPPSGTDPPDPDPPSGTDPSDANGDGDGAGDGGGGGGAEGAGDDADAPSPGRGSATLTVNAFNGTLAYFLDLSDAPGPYAPEGATLHLGDPAVGGPVAFRFADAEKLGDTIGGVVTGVVLEADSGVRFADLLLAPGGAYIQVSTASGDLRGVLRAPTD